MVICLYSSASEGDRRQEDLFCDRRHRQVLHHLSLPSTLPSRVILDWWSCLLCSTGTIGWCSWPVSLPFTGPQLTGWIPSFAQADCCLIVHFDEAKLALLSLLGLSHCWCLCPLASDLFAELVGGLNFACNALAAFLSIMTRELAFWTQLIAQWPGIF